MTEQKAVIEGMKCEGCAETVASKLTSLQGVREVTIDLDEKTAAIQSDRSHSMNELIQALEDTAYKVKDVKEF